MENRIAAKLLDHLFDRQTRERIEEGESAATQRKGSKSKGLWRKVTVNIYKADKFVLRCLSSTRALYSNWCLTTLVINVLCGEKTIMLSQIPGNG